MKTKKLLSIILAVIMVIGLVPCAAFAADDYVAEVNGTKYATLLEAVDAAAAGDTIEMIADVEILDEEEVAFGTVYEMPENSTLDLNGYTLTLRYARALFAGKNITICNGTITPPSTKNTDYALYIGNAMSSDAAQIETSVTVKDVDVVNGGICLLYGAKATLENVNVTVNPNRKYYAVYVNSGAEVIINSGSFTGGRKNVDVLKAADATVTVYNGTFANGVNTSYLAPGRDVAENADGSRTISGYIPVAEVGGTKYATLLDAINAAQAGDTITMIDDFEILDADDVAANTVYELPEGCTLDLNGYNLALRMTRAIFAGKNITIKNGTMTPPTGKNNDYVLYIGYTGYETSITIQDVEIIKSGINVVADADVTLINVTATVNPNRKYYAVYAAPGTNVTIESGTYTGGRNKIDVYKAEGAGVVINSGTFANTVDESNVAAESHIIANADGTYTVEAHAYTAAVTAPTCTAAGFTTYTCTCGNSYIADEVAATGHLNTEVIGYVEATYEADGYTGDTYCKDCGEMLAAGETISQLVAPEEDDSSDGKRCGFWEIIFMILDFLMKIVSETK